MSISSKELLNQLFIFSIFSLIMLVLSGNAMADVVSADADQISVTLCKAMNLVTGGPGKIVGSLAIVSIGIMFFTGKVSWGTMLGAAFGVAAMFGAPTIVAVLSGDDAVDCSSID